MKIKRAMIMVSIFAAFQVGCSGLEIATSQVEVDAIQKIRSGQYELVKTDELTQLRKDAEIGKNVGRFQVHREGYRTWRLDTATGTSCLLLTTAADWEKPASAISACK